MTSASWFELMITLGLCCAVVFTREDELARNAGASNSPVRPPGGGGGTR